MTMLAESFPSQTWRRPSPSVAVLIIGLARFTENSTHLAQLSGFLNSFPGGQADVFAVIEHTPGAANGCARPRVTVNAAA